MLRGLLVHTRMQRPHRDWARPAFECLSPAEAGSAAVCHGDRGCGRSRPGRLSVWHKSTEPPSRWPTNWTTIISKTFSHCCKSSKTHNRVPSLRIWQRDWLRKDRGTRDQIAIIWWTTEKAREFQKNSTSVVLITPKPLTVWITANWKIFQEMRTPNHLACLLRNLYAGQEATVKTGHGTMDLFQIGKGVHQDYILTPYLFILCRVYHVECQIGWSTNWNQDCHVKYQ